MVLIRFIDRQNDNDNGKWYKYVCITTITNQMLNLILNLILILTLLLHSTE